MIRDSDDGSRAMWDAVDTLTKPTRTRITREGNEWLHTLTGQGFASCDVADYRAATATWATIPSLWRQAEMALTTGTESSESNPSPPASRAPADLDLMEIMLTIREHVAGELVARHLPPRATVPRQIRQLAAHVVGHEPERVAWWLHCFASWSRVLAVYLHAIDVGPRSVRLRAPCPICNTRAVAVMTDQGPVQAPPIVIDFADGLIRAATCTACDAVWWRGDSLLRLAALFDDTGNASA